MKEEDYIVATFERRGEERLGLHIAFGDEDGVPSDGGDLREKVSHGLSKLSQDWTETAVGFFDIVPVLSELGSVMADYHFDEGVYQLAKETAKKGPQIEEEADGIRKEVFYIPKREAPRVAKQLGEGRRFSTTATVLKRSALTALLAEYEALIIEIVRFCGQIRPEAFLSEDLVISSEALKDYDSLEELRDDFLNRKIEDFLHGESHIEVLKRLSSKFGVNLTSDTKLLAEFAEICQRRHLISHAGSRVNKRYVRLCLEAGCDENMILPLGSRVSVDRKYLRRATARVYQVGFFTLHILWQKVLNEVSASDSAVLWASHVFLEEKLTKMTRRVASFSLERKNRAVDRAQAYLLINKAQSYKFDSNIPEDERAKEVEDVLAARDWSDSSAVSQLALACLRNEESKYRRLVIAAASQTERPLTYADVFTWNIFREARQVSSFIEGVQDAFAVNLQIEGSKGQKLLENKAD